MKNIPGGAGFLSHSIMVCHVYCLFLLWRQPSVVIVRCVVNGLLAASPVFRCFFADFRKKIPRIGTNP